MKVEGNTILQFSCFLEIFFLNLVNISTLKWKFLPSKIKSFKGGNNSHFSPQPTFFVGWIRVVLTKKFTVRSVICFSCTSLLGTLPSRGFFKQKILIFRLIKPPQQNSGFSSVAQPKGLRELSLHFSLSKTLRKLNSRMRAFKRGLNLIYN